jgi:hypothetical protein
MTDCPNGCASNVCDGDPCVGVTCTTPPARFCVDASHLRVFNSPGACSGGTCSYTNQDEFCAFGCVNGACANDPCQGVTCTTPPANYCSSATTRRVYTSPGTCSGGACSYMYTDQTCQYGCSNGVCLQCTVDVNCGSGMWCNSGTCTPCNTDPHCGAMCTNCTATSEHCNTAGTACVQCNTDNQCVSGDYCNGGTCAVCNVNAHCGASCVACGSYNQCVSGACQECTTVAACGATCSLCGGSTPYCQVTGATSQCVQCLVNGNCATGQTCVNGTCVSTCNAPASACGSTGDQNGGCSGAYTISRTTAQSTFEEPDDYGLCNRSDNFGTVAGCESGGGSGADAEYKLFMKTGESIHVTLTRGASTCVSGWANTISLKIYGTPCSADCSSCPQTCSTVEYCAQSNSQSTTFVAPASGWYDIVVDTRDQGDVGGVYDLKVTLTCPGGTCTCP